MEEETSMSLSDHLLVVKEITTDELFQRVQAEAAADPNGHIPRFPTHVCTIGGEIVGSLSCCAMPVSGIWSHSVKSNARATVEMVNMARNLSRLITGGKQIVTMCSEKSPIYPYMTKMDFIDIGPTHLFLDQGGS